MKQVPNIPQRPPPGLIEAIEAEGIGIKNGDHDLWYATDEKRAAEIAETFDPTAHVKAEKAVELAEARWRKETGGFMFQPKGADRPYRFKSTRDAMGPILALPVFALIGITTSRRWKTDEVDEKGNAIFVTIEAVDFAPFATAFGAHVEAAFAEEEAKGAQVKSADWQDVAAIKIEAAIADKA